MSSTTATASSGGSKWNDYYEFSSPWYWVLQVCLTLYGAAAVAYLVLLENTHVIDTVFASLPGGTYYTGRYITFVWYAVMLSAAKVLMYPVANAAVMFRATRGCSILWYILIAALTFTHVVVIMGLGDQYSKCNQSGQRGNLCNDPLWCCAPQIYSVTSNGCFNTGPCVAPYTKASIAQLSPSVDFLWLFWTNFGFLLADILLLLFFGLVFLCCPVAPLGRSRKAPEPSAPPQSPKGKREEEDGEDDEEVEDEDIASEDPLDAAAAAIGKPLLQPYVRRNMAATKRGGIK